MTSGMGSDKNAGAQIFYLDLAICPLVIMLSYDFVVIQFDLLPWSFYLVKSVAQILYRDSSVVTLRS